MVPGAVIDDGPHPDILLAVVQLAAGIAEIVSSLPHPRTYINPTSAGDLEVTVTAAATPITVPALPANIPKVFADITVEGGNIRYRHVPLDLAHTPLDATHGSLLSDGQGFESSAPELFQAFLVAGSPKLHIEFFGYGQAT